MSTLVLSTSDVEQLQAITKKGKHGARVVMRARVLLKLNADTNAKGSADFGGCSKRTAERIRERCTDGGIARALYDAPRSGQPLKITEAIETYLVAVACSSAPSGRDHWTLDLLQKCMVKDKKVKSVSTVALWNHLKARGIKPWREKNVVHPEAHR